MYFPLTLQFVNLAKNDKARKKITDTGKEDAVAKLHI